MEFVSKFADLESLTRFLELSGAVQAQLMDLSGVNNDRFMGLIM